MPPIPPFLLKKSFPSSAGSLPLAPAGYIPMPLKGAFYRYSFPGFFAECRKLNASTTGELVVWGPVVCYLKEPLESLS